MKTILKVNMNEVNCICGHPKYAHYAMHMKHTGYCGECEAILHGFCDAKEEWYLADACSMTDAEVKAYAPIVDQEMDDFVQEAIDVGCKRYCMDSLDFIRVVQQEKDKHYGVL